MSGLQKNVAGQKYRVFAFNYATNTAKTGDAANITCKVDKDWAGATALADTNPTEREDGYYLFDLAQGETNAYVLDFYPQSSTASIQVIGVPGTVYTIPPAWKIPNVGTVTTAVPAITSGTIGTVNLVTTATNLTNLPAAPTDWLTAAAVKADAVTKIQNGLATPTNITSGSIGTVNVVVAKTGYSLAPGATVDLVDSPNATAVAAIKTALEADGSKLDHLWEMTENDGGTRRLTTNALEQAPSGTGGDATAANQTTIINAIATMRGADNDTLKTLSDQIDLVSGTAGAGADLVTVTVQDASANPIPNAEVWITSDADGSTVVAGTLVSDDSGQVQFLLNDGGTYYLWARKAGAFEKRGEQFQAVAD